MENSNRRVLRNKRPARKRPENVETNAAPETNKSEIESNKLEAEFDQSEKSLQTPNSFLTVVSTSLKKNRLLTAALVASVLLAIGFHIILPFTGEAISTVESKDIASVDTKALKGGEQLLVANISGGTLIAAASEEWKSLSDGEKREKLKSILAQSEKFNFRNVMIFNSKGDIVGNATPKEIKLY